MPTYSDTSTDLIINRLTKTQFESATGLDPTQCYEVDPQFTGNKLLQTDATGDIIESTIDPTTVGTVTDVQVDGTSVVTSGVASIDLTGYETIASIEALDATDSITLTDNTIYNGSTQTSLSITLWAAPTVSSICQVLFTSGSTETAISFSGTINWLGDDLIYDATLQKFIFGPVANKRYTIMFYYDGVNTIGIVKGV